MDGILRLLFLAVLVTSSAGEFEFETFMNHFGPRLKDWQKMPPQAFVMETKEDTILSWILDFEGKHEEIGNELDEIEETLDESASDESGESTNESASDESGESTNESASDESGELTNEEHEEHSHEHVHEVDEAERHEHEQEEHEVEEYEHAHEEDKPDQHGSKKDNEHTSQEDELLSSEDGEGYDYVSFERENKKDTCPVKFFYNGTPSCLFSFIIGIAREAHSIVLVALHHHNNEFSGVKFHLVKEPQTEESKQFAQEINAVRVNPFDIHQIDTILKVIDSKLKEDSNLPQSDNTLPQRDSSLPQDDSNLPQSDGNLPQSDSNLPQSDSNLPQSDSNLPQKDSNLPQSDSNLNEMFLRGNLSWMKQIHENGIKLQTQYKDGKLFWGQTVIVDEEILKKLEEIVIKVTKKNSESSSSEGNSS